MKIRMMIILFFSVLGCAGNPVTREDLLRQDREKVLAIESLREKGNADQAIEDSLAFQKTNPESSYFQAARYEEARALELKGNFSDAETIYRDVRDKTLSVEPELATKSEWRLSFTAEAAGNDLAALAHALSAERRKSDLPNSTAQVEIPARKAILLYRLGRPEEAAFSMNAAEKGLNRLLSILGEKPSNTWLAQLYLDMGRIFVGSPTTGDVNAYIQSQRLSQKYLLRSLRLGDDKVSPQALTLLKDSTMNLWGPFQRREGMDQNERIRNLSEFSRMLDEARALRPLPSMENTWEKTYFEMIDELSRQATAQLYETPETTVLTEESRLLNGLRRMIPVQTTPSAHERQ